MRSADFIKNCDGLTQLINSHRVLRYARALIFISEKKRLRDINQLSQDNETNEGVTECFSNTYPNYKGFVLIMVESVP